MKLERYAFFVLLGCLAVIVVAIVGAAELISGEL